MNIANHNPNYVPWAVLIFDLQWRFQELDLCHCKTFPDGGKGETWHGGLENSVWPSSESGLWFWLQNNLHTVFGLYPGLFFTGGNDDFDSVFIKTLGASTKRLKLLLLVMYVNSVSIINGKFWGKKWKHPGIFFPSWYKNGIFKLTFFSPGNVFYILKDCGLTSGWNHSKIEEKSEENHQPQMSVKSYWETLSFSVGKCLFFY